MSLPLPEYESFDALGLARLARSGEVSPSELVEAALVRIDARNPALNAVVHRADGAARAQARGPLPEGPFRGVPFLLKDLLAAWKGHPLTSACRFLAGFVPDHDSELVRRHHAAGLVLLGRTNTPELGIMGVTEPKLYGPTRNPWNLAHTPGGSSGGSAAAVAAGLVPMAHGGDGGGSIRIPASCCGLFGLKPTRGRNPLGPDVGEAWAGLVQEHGLTRSVRDSAALLDATCGPDLGAPYAAPVPERRFLEEVGAPAGRLRVAFSTGSLFGEHTHPECRAAVEESAALLRELGHDVEEAAPEFNRDQLRHAYLTVVAVGTARGIDLAGSAVGRRPKAADFEPATWLLGLIGWKLSGARYLAALDLTYAAARQVAAFFQRYDLLLTSTMAYPPALIGELDPSRVEAAAMAVLRAVPAKRLLLTALDRLAAEALERTANTMLFNQTGQPAMSVPLHWTNDGLPIGVQIAARTGAEATLFRVAAQLEEARPWFGRRPPLFDPAG